MGARGEAIRGPPRSGGNDDRGRHLVADDPARQSAEDGSAGVPADDGPGWSDDAAEALPPRRAPLGLWRIALSAAIGFFGTHGTLLAFSVFGLPALLLFIVLGTGAAVIDDRRRAFVALVLGATAYFAFITLLYLGARPEVDAQYDVLAPVVVVAGGAIAALLAGSGYLLHRLLVDRAPDRTIDG